MRIQFLGAGLWARGLTSMSALESLLALPVDRIDAAFEAPKPVVIPAKERRRAGLMINLAVEVAHQACEQAGVDKRTVPSVFTSAMGDTAITDYMCRELTKPEPLLSPTKFHNSVHNAPSGYWTISAANHAPSTYVGGFAQSFGAALFEAASQCCATAAPVLLVATDIATQTPFDELVPVHESMAIGLVLTGAGADSALPHRADVHYRHYGDDAPLAAQPQHPAVAALAIASPIGTALALLEHMLRPVTVRNHLYFAAAPGAVLEVKFLEGGRQ